MSELSRHIPLIALTILFAVSMYYVYRSLTAVSHRVENLSQELYYGLNSVTELAAKMEGTSSGSLEPMVPSVVPMQTTAAVITPDDVLVSGIIPDDAKSVESADIVVNGGKAASEKTDRRTSNKRNTSPVQQTSQLPQEQQVTQSAQEDTMDDVNAYIGKLEEKFVNRPEPNNNDDDDIASVGSEVSSVSALNGKKKVPPYAAKSFPLGYKQEWNGKVYETIRTRAGSIRWSKAMPLDVLAKHENSNEANLDVEDK